MDVPYMCSLNINCAFKMLLRRLLIVNLCTDAGVICQFCLTFHYFSSR